MPAPAKLDKDRVLAMAIVGCTIAEIAAVMGVSRDTIERRCRKEIDLGREKGNASLRKKQWEMAMAGDKTMLIWLGKNRLNQADKAESKVDHTSGNEPLRFTFAIAGDNADGE